jgi:glycosyltransferase involved in cell wall biosynthesis
MTNPNLETVVVILVGTYNGAAYLAEQLSSLISQTIRPSHIVIRDDGSSDQTVAILNDFKTRYPELIAVHQGPNLGFVGNFMTLLTLCPAEATHVFFCDQDDQWLPEKIERAVTCLNTQVASRVPGLYFCRLTYTDSHLNPIGESPYFTRTGLGHALFENVATGCTIAMNGSLIATLKAQQPHLQSIVAHDWWVYLVASALGTIVFDDTPTILYRQHGGNSLGAEKSFVGDLFQRYRNFRSGTWAKKRPKPMISELMRLYGSRLLPERTKLIEDGIFYKHGLWGALKLYVSGQIWRHSSFIQLLLAWLLVRGRNDVKSYVPLSS